MTGRFLCVYFPDLSLNRYCLEAKESIDNAVLVQKRANAFHVVGLGLRASEIGLTVGVTLSEARAILPDLKVVMEDCDADLDILERLARAMERYTPLVALDAPDGLMLDISGCSHLFGGEHDMAKNIASRLEGWGFHARVAVCGNPTAARAMARHGPGGVIPEAQEFSAVSPLPVVALRLPEGGADVLARLGLKTVGEVAEQPRAALARRFGPSIALALDRLRGQHLEPISPLRPAVSMTVERRFAEPLVSVEGIVSVVGHLSGQLSTVLQTRGEGARELRLSLFHADGIVRETGVGLSEPSADPKRLTALLSPRIEALSSRVETESGIDLMRLGAPQTGPMDAVQADFDANANRIADLAQLIDTLTERLGASRVQRIVPIDTHQPEDAERRVPATSQRCGAPWPEPKSARPLWPRMGPDAVPQRPLRLFSPPEPVEALASVPDGPPVRFVWRRVAYRVATAEGPERISQEWWQEVDLRTRDYFTVEDMEGRRFWLFREGLYGRETNAPAWFIHGLFP